jgi:hypothetical protein
VAKLTLGAGFDADGLDSTEYDDSFEPYAGPLPPVNTILKFRLVKAFASESSNGNFMIKTIFTAEEAGEFDGLTIFDNITFVETAAFHYQPFLQAMGLTAKRIKAQTIIGDDDDARFNAPPILSIGKWKPGSDDAVCFIKTGIDAEYDPDKPKAVAAKYIPLDEGPEDYAPARPKASQTAPRVQQARRATAKPPEDDSLFGDDDPPPF